MKLIKHLVMSVAAMAACVAVPAMAEPVVVRIASHVSALSRNNFV